MGLCILGGGVCYGQMEKVAPQIIDNSLEYNKLIESDFNQDKLRENYHPLSDFISDLFIYWYLCKKEKTNPVLLYQVRSWNLLHGDQEIIKIYKTLAKNPLNIKPVPTSIGVNSVNFSYREYKELSMVFYHDLFLNPKFNKKSLVKSNWIERKIK